MSDKSLDRLLTCFSYNKLATMLIELDKTSDAQLKLNVDKMDLTELQATQILLSAEAYAEVRAGFVGIEPEPERRANIVKILRWAADEFEGKGTLDG